MKICVDAGFTCPNRDGKKGFGGCIYCGERGSGENTKRISINEQIHSFLSSYRGERANQFILYFQNFTNSYAPIEALKDAYNHVFDDSRIIGLEIATRADCVSHEFCELLTQYKEKGYYVCVELGFQTSNEVTHKLTNQLITNDEVKNAVALLNEFNIPVVLHVMVGLLGETHEDIKNTVSFLNTLSYQGIKIHSTYVIEGTKLNELYQEGKYQPIDYDTYMEELVYIITHIDKEVIVHRINADPPKDRFVAPEWMLHKKKVLNQLEKMLKENSLVQGIKK